MLRQLILKTYTPIHRLMMYILIGLLLVYRYCVSPWLGNRCRFYPSCSEYAQEAIREWGIFKGIGRTIWRLLRCHPLHAGGYDPVIHKRIPS